MAKTTSFVLDDDLESFIREQVESGEFSSASELVRTALTAFAEQTRKEVAFYEALDRGVRSKRARPGVFERVRSRHGARK
jgi:antitoxin ParD1/3/4